MAGFRGPLLPLGLSAGTAQAGFRGPLPLPPIGGGAGATQAGFIGPIPLLNLGAIDAIVIPVPPSPGGSMGVPTRFGGGQLDRTAFGDDDEVLMMVIRRFLERVE